MDPIHHTCLVDSLHGSFESSDYSDMIVRCGSEEFHLHRVIVCPRSKFFAAACNGQYQESKTGVIDLKEDDPPTVGRMLTYLYTLDYYDGGNVPDISHYLLGSSTNLDTTAGTPCTEETAQIINNIAVYAIAGKYDIPELKALAKTKFGSLLSQQELTADIPRIISAVFETTASSDSGLRDVAVEFCTSRIQGIMGSDDMSRLFKENGELGLGVVGQVIREHHMQLAQIIDDWRKHYGTRTFADFNQIIHKLELSLKSLSK